MQKEDRKGFVDHPLIRKNTMESRLYQESILETAIKNNTLCVIPTGLGKTSIAIMLAADRLTRFPDSKILVTAPTRPLVSQHKKIFARFLDIPEDEFVVVLGTVPPASRTPLYRRKLVFATPQTIQNDLENKRMSLKDFSLLVLDETHHAIGRYAYPYIAKAYLEESEHPRILGLTASPGGTREKIQEICRNVGIEAIEIRTEQDQDVLPWVKGKEVEWINVELPENFKVIQRILKDAYADRLDKLKRMNFLYSRRINKRGLLKLQADLMKEIKSGNKRAFGGVSLTAQAIKIEHALGLLETQGIAVLEKYWKKIRQDSSRSAQAMIKDKSIDRAMFLTQGMFDEGASHPKMGKLCSVIVQELERNQKSKIIVFANYRDSVKEIYNTLKKIDTVKPAILIGQREGLSQKKQIEIIREFELDVHNCLITTSIGEEGLHLSSADVAVFYEPVPSEIREIQRRGRVARIKIGKVIILITTDTRDEAYFWTARRKEKRMHGTLYEMQEKGLGSST